MNPYLSIQFILFPAPKYGRSSRSFKEKTPISITNGGGLLS